MGVGVDLEGESDLIQALHPHFQLKSSYVDTCTVSCSVDFLHMHTVSGCSLRDGLGASDGADRGCHLQGPQQTLQRAGLAQRQVSKAHYSRYILITHPTDSLTHL